MPATHENSNRIDASPTKDFFIHMLIRDIPLNRAVIDLVDNSVDGARRLKGGGGYQGLWIRLEIVPTEFRIADNCGGITIAVARDYAFRFGRPEGAPSVPGSIGQFGVGMKRTFFKLGQHFNVNSSTETSRFTIDIDVEEWKRRKNAEGEEDWHFDFRTLEPAVTVPQDEQGTIISVTKLHASVGESFAEDSFIRRVCEEISTAHALSMNQGLSITVNGIPLQYDPLNLLNSSVLQPAYVSHVYDAIGPVPVKVKLYAGVSERSKEEGGWYVFCNGRMVLRADQTNLTIWDEDDRVPKYHATFARFRGLAYFESDNASLLPWTTTKTGVDSDSPVYRAARQQMIEISRPVLEFLRKLEDERKQHENGDITDTPLAQALETAKPENIEGLAARTVFVAPPPPPPYTGPRLGRILYYKPVTEIDDAKKLLGVSAARDVGEKTFEYYMEYEGGKNAG